jgi:hypothetical protein
MENEKGMFSREVTNGRTKREQCKSPRLLGLLGRFGLQFHEKEHQTIRTKNKDDEYSSISPPVIPIV